MDIEDFWADIDIYHVSFEVGKAENGIDSLRIVDKIVALPSGISEEEVIRVVSKRFSKVKKVQCVDFWENGLLLKEQVYNEPVFY